MGALPSDSNAYFCNKNLTGARDTAENMLEYFSEVEVSSGMEELANIIGYTYNTTYSCYYAVYDSYTE